MDNKQEEGNTRAPKYPLERYMPYYFTFTVPCASLVLKTGTALDLGI